MGELRYGTLSVEGSSLEDRQSKGNSFQRGESLNERKNWHIQ